GLVGRNGAGKTTTLRSIVGLVPILGGSISLNGQNLSSRSPHERARLGIGYLPEDRRLIGSLTVQENLLLPLWAAGQNNDQKRLAFVYDLMPEVKRLADRRAAALSGGQQKMVALARAVMAGRTLLLLDEPFEGLAPLLSRHLAEVIRALRDVAVLVTESDVNRMRLLTDQICTIERGEMVLDSGETRLDAQRHEGGGACGV
ncbi:MAG TPA: ATP-binding cassette domain-containing protein, partial [Candidatus Methylomirabilis sp.]|nr:ATP-binding cassette domain-containing protein [Candidatus Methylomirabilis sp.]